MPLTTAVSGLNGNLVKSSLPPDLQLQFIDTMFAISTYTLSINCLSWDVAERINFWVDKLIPEIQRISGIYELGINRVQIYTVEEEQLFTEIDC